MNVLVIGGTGTMGRLVIDRLLEKGHAVTCFSRDEQKQRSLPNDPNMTGVVGDIRDFEAVSMVMESQFDAVLNLAALKCVDTVEANPLESVKTNVLGVQNVIRACQNSSLPKLFFTSSDKACYPINVYGQCKAIGEKLVNNYTGSSTVFRYGNILGSRGSVLSTFLNSLWKGGIANITDVNMTRFWVTSDEIADTIANQIDANTSDTSLSIKLSKTMRVVDVAKAVAEVIGLQGKIRYNEIGMRPGEKIHETLVTKYDGLNGNENDIDSFSHERYELDEFKEIIRPIVARLREAMSL